MQDMIGFILIVFGDVDVQLHALGFTTGGIYQIQISFRTISAIIQLPGHTNREIVHGIFMVKAYSLRNPCQLYQLMHLRNRLEDVSAVE